MLPIYVDEKLLKSIVTKSYITGASEANRVAIGCYGNSKAEIAAEDFFQLLRKELSKEEK